MLVRALARERDASSCGHCNEKGATVSKAAPPIIPSIPNFFMIGLPDDNPGLAKCASRLMVLNFAPTCGVSVMALRLPCAIVDVDIGRSSADRCSVGKVAPIHESLVRAATL